MAAGIIRVGGRLDSHGTFDFEAFDDEVDDYKHLEITCPECGEEVFDSNEARLEKYYHPR
jgi:hypothetical protein